MYHGFWKSPGGSHPVTGKATFPPLSAYGASVRGRVGSGIGNVEFSYYDSRDDRSGEDPFVNNSQLRFLIGYEQEVAAWFPDIKNFTVAGQYYVEHMLDYDEYRDNLPPGIRAKEEGHHIFTLRLTKLLMNQNLELSLFTFYSPSDDDAYFRPAVHYDITDNWSVMGGGNFFVGDEDHTFFGQFERNSNVYAGVRYGF